MAINQAYLFIIFTINGIFIGLLFDFFRILRKSFKTNNVVTYFEDALFWIISGISIIFLMYKFSDGNLRVFMFLGIILGICMYLVTISKYVISFSVCIINFIKKIIKKCLEIFLFPIKKIIKLCKKTQ